jgi:hypothetical protein
MRVPDDFHSPQGLEGKKDHMKGQLGLGKKKVN